nr:tail fiber protein [uncultured Allomuricauda sp.]
MKHLYIFIVLCSHVTVFAQQQYAESESPNNMASGVYYQNGPGSNNTILNWTYPYGTKLTVLQGASRNFEIASTTYPYGELKVRQWNTTSNAWIDWRNIVVQDQNGNYGLGTSQALAFLEVNKSINNSWTTKIYNGGGNGQGLLVQSGYGGAQSSNSPTILQLEDGNGNMRMKVQSNGKVGIGTSSPDSKLTVNGRIHAEEVKVDLSVPGPDYVFKEDYDLKPLEEVQNYIEEHGHLPNIPSAKEMEENGVRLGKMNMKLLEKIEELTLYVIQVKNENDRLKLDMEKLKNKK